MFSVFILFKIYPLNLGIKSRKLVHCAHQQLEVIDVKLLPALTGSDDEDSWRIGKRALKRDATDDVVKIDQFALVSHESKIRIIRKHFIVVERLLDEQVALKMPRLPTAVV